MSPPILLSIRSSYWFIISTICIAVFTDVFLYGLIVPVLPFALSERADVPAQDVQHWISVLLAVYGAALLALSPICGWLADRSSSRRLPLLFGLLALGGATILLCLGRSIAALVIGRLLQGFSAAVVWTVGLALLVDTVGQQGIGQAIGYITLAISLAILVGPLLGGVVYGRAGYYPVYYMAFALIFLDILLRLLLVEKKVATKWAVGVTQKDGTGTEKVVAPKVSLMPAPDEAVPKETKITESRRSRLPPIITLLASRRLDAALWGCLTQAAIMTAFDSVLPLRVKNLWGWDSTGAGLIFLAIVVPSFTAPVIGKYSDKYGPRWFTVMGFVLGCPILTLLRFVDHDSLGQKVLVCALLALLGIVLNMALTPLMAEITYVVEAKEKHNPGLYGEKGAYAQAYGLFNSAFAAGTLIGPIWGGFVLQKAGWATMVWTLGLLSIVCAVPAAIWTGGLITKRHNSASRWNRQGEKDDERGLGLEQEEAMDQEKMDKKS